MIDEPLFLLKSRCRFTQCMPNKPNKFNIKFWLAVDVECNYFLIAIPYLGKDESRPSTQRLSNNAFIISMESFMGKGRNVITDNFFTSFLLAKELKKKKTSLVGTMNKVKPELPASAKCLQQRLFYFMKADDMATLTVYQCKPKKNVCVLNSLDMSVELGKFENKKPETVEFYNKTKSGVDVVDQMARQYSVKAGTCRWPAAVLYNIFDLIGISAFVLYKKRTGDKVSRRNFLFKLATELREDYIVERSNRNTTITRLHQLSTAPKNSKAEKPK